MDKSTHYAGSFLDYPLLKAKTVQQEVVIRKGASVAVDVSLTYESKEFATAPTKVFIKMTKPQGQFALLPAAQNLSQDQLAEELKAVDVSAEPTRASFFDVGALVSYPSNDPIELNIGETIVVKMKIAIPSDFPEELLNKKLKVNPNFTIDSKLVAGMTSGPLVTINDS